MGKEIENFWEEFCAANPDIDPKTKYQVWYFGTTPELSEELWQLAASGKKKATAFSPWLCEDKPEKIPIPDGISVVTNFYGEPKLIVRTVELRTIPFNEVDTEFAFDEGEGDQSLEFWREVHRDYFTKELNKLGKEFSDKMPVFCERFEVLYPKPK